MSSLEFSADFENMTPPEKPREKLLRYGPKALSLWELVALILRLGKHSKQYSEDVMMLAKRLLAEVGFRGIFTQENIPAVQENFGVYKHHAETIVAISEICRRLQGKYDVFDAAEPSKVFERFRFLQHAKQEQCFVLHLDNEQKCIYQEIVAIGAGNRVQVFPSDVLRTAIWIGTRAIVVVHNHPGSARASKEDIAWTLAIAKGAHELHRIALIDHIIIGKDGYFSFLEKGLL